MKHEKLWIAYRKTSNVRLRDELFVRYYDWALKVAGSVPFFLPDCGTQHDDIQGLVAEELLACIERFTPDRGVEFEAYARKRVRGCVLNAIGKELRHVKGKVGVGFQDEAMSRLDEASLEIENLVIEVLLENFVLEDRYSPDSILFRDSQLSRILESALAVLTPNEFAAIYGHFFEDQRKTDVADRLGVSRGRVSQLLAAAYKKLRDTLLHHNEKRSFY